MKFRIVFWDVLPCKIIVDRRFRGTCGLNYVPPNRRSTIILHDRTSQKTILNFFWVVTPCSLKEADHYFREIYCLHYQVHESIYDGGSKHL
jgi:hypothetical protein